MGAGLPAIPRAFRFGSDQSRFGREKIMSTVTQPAVNPGGASFARHLVVDRAHGGLVASAIDYPAGWQAESNLTWNLEQMSAPWTASGRAFNPRGHEAIDLFNCDSFCHLQPDYGFYWPGQSLLGQYYLAPLTAAQAISGWIIPRYRKKQRDFRVVAAPRSLPDLPQRFGIPLNGQAADGAVARVEYTLEGVPVEEELYCITSANQVPYQGPMGTTIQTNWMLTRPVAIRAARGSLDGLKDTFLRIIRSIRVNPAWVELHDQILREIKVRFDRSIQMGYSQIQAAGEMSRAISANNDAMLAGFERTRASQRMADARHGEARRSTADSFDDYIRGVVTVEDPYWGESQQDGNYSYHWTDGTGGYRPSNDPNFDPNLTSPGSWSLMRPKP